MASMSKALDLIHSTTKIIIYFNLEIISLIYNYGHRIRENIKL
jgi:hypothetical protein